MTVGATALHSDTRTLRAFGRVGPPRGQDGPQLVLQATKPSTYQLADPGMPEPVWLSWPCSSSPDQPRLPAEAARSRPMDVFNLYFPLPFGPHSTPGQLSNLEVELHLSVNDGAGDVAVMRHRA